MKTSDLMLVRLEIGQWGSFAHQEKHQGLITVFHFQDIQEAPKGHYGKNADRNPAAASSMAFLAWSITSGMPKKPWIMPL